MTVFPPDRGILAAGLRWLYDTVQPDGAIINHHGTIRNTTYDDRAYGFCPSGAKGLPVISVTIPHWGRDADGQLAPVLEAGEMDVFTAAVEGLGVVTRETWNGADCLSGSIGLAEPAHPSLVAAVRRYGAGCPVHDTVFCDSRSWAENHNVPPCDWYSKGSKLIVGADWPSRIPWQLDAAVSVFSQLLYRAELNGHTFILLSTDRGVTWVAQRDGRMVSNGAVSRDEAIRAADAQWRVIVKERWAGDCLR